MATHRALRPGYWSEKQNDLSRTSIDLLSRCGLELECDLHFSQNPPGSIVSEEIRTQLMLADLASSDALDRGAHLRRKPLNLVEPAPHASLRNVVPADFGKFSRHSALPVQQIDGSAERNSVNAHGEESDKNACLSQQSTLLAGDKPLGRPYVFRMKNDSGTPQLATLAARLKWAMEQMDQDDKKVAADVSRALSKKIPWQTIQSIRLGNSQSSRYLTQIADSVKVSAKWLSTGEGEPYGAKAPTFLGAHSDLTPASLAFARRWQALPAHLKPRVYEVLVAFEALASSETPSMASTPSAASPEKLKR